MPNLGPEVFTAFYGVELLFKEVTSYAIPNLKDWSQLDKIKLDYDNSYFYYKKPPPIKVGACSFSITAAKKPYSYKI